MDRLASVLVYVELCWLEKGPAVPGLPAQVTLHLPRVFPCQQSSFCAGCPGKPEPASKPLQCKLWKDGCITASQQPVLSPGNWALCLLPQRASGYWQHGLPPQLSEGASFPPAFLQGT